MMYICTYLYYLLTLFTYIFSHECLTPCAPPHSYLIHLLFFIFIKMAILLLHIAFIPVFHSTIWRFVSIHISLLRFGRVFVCGFGHLLKLNFKKHQKIVATATTADDASISTTFGKRNIVSYELNARKRLY